jgi:hypothetical protein
VLKIIFGLKINEVSEPWRGNVTRSYTVYSNNLLIVGQLDIELYNGWDVLKEWKIGKFQRDVGANERIIYIM